MFFFNETATTEISPLSQPDALPIFILDVVYNHTAEGNHMGPTLSFRGIDNGSYYRLVDDDPQYYMDYTGTGNSLRDRKSTRLNSSHANISYAVFCLKKKNKQISVTQPFPSSIYLNVGHLPQHSTPRPGVHSPEPQRTLHHLLVLTYSPSIPSQSLVI